jgi:hypothetical protein
MTPLGWIFMTLSLLFVWGLTAWCFYKVLTARDTGRESAD